MVRSVRPSLAGTQRRSASSSAFVAPRPRRVTSRHVTSRRGLTGAMSTPEAPSSRVDSGEGGGRRHGGGFGRRKFPEECKEAKLKLELCYAENMTGFFFIPCRVSFLSSASLACRGR